MLAAVAIVAILITTSVILVNRDDTDAPLVTLVPVSHHRIVPGSVFPGGQMQTHTIILGPSDHAALPVVAPLLPLRDIDSYIDWGTGDNVAVNDLSLFSSVMALTFFPEAGRAIVVEDYTCSLLAVPLSVTMNAPILYGGETTNEALWRLGATGRDDIISIGRTDYTGRVSVSLGGRGEREGGDIVTELGLEVADHTLRIMVANGVSPNYITVTNPNDHNTTRADVPHLSAFSSTLAAFRGGIILTVEGAFEDIYHATHTAVPMFRDHGFEPEYLALVGDAKALPFGHMSFDCYIEDGYPEQNPVPSDNPYADFDDNPFTVEIANGRLLNKNLGEMSEYMHRNIHYESYLAETSAPMVQLPTIRHTEGGYLDGWNNNALVYCAAGAWFDPKSEHHVWREFYDNGGFNTQDDSPESHTQYSGFVDEHTSILTRDFAMSNLIAINADHGNKHSTVTFDSADLREMPPNVIFGVSCQLGWTDNVDIQRSMTYTMMEKGTHAFIAATRITYGVISTDTVTDPPTEKNDKAAPGLSRLFYEDLIANDNTVGKSLMNAKAALLDTRWDSIFNDEEWSINEVVSWQYHVYGDPAFNPYEPVNEGR